MDGVVADFNEYAHRIHNLKPLVEYPDNDWNKIAKNIRLYKELKKTPYANDLVNYCRTFARMNNMDLFFLTAVPKSNRMHWAFYDKVTWGMFYFSDIPVHFGPFSKDKHMHCKFGDILIDDRTSNIEEWNNAGGIGILHTDYKKTIESLKNHENTINRK